MEIGEFAEGCMSDSTRWFGDQVSQDLMVLTLGLTGEAGEVADIVKKIGRGSITVQEAVDHLREELVDVGIYWAQLLQLLDIGDTFEIHYKRKRALNEVRFGGQN